MTFPPFPLPLTPQSCLQAPFKLDINGHCDIEDLEPDLFRLLHPTSPPRVLFFVVGHHSKDPHYLCMINDYGTLRHSEK